MKVSRCTQGQNSESAFFSMGRIETFLLFCGRNRKCGFRYIIECICACVHAQSVWLFAISWTVAHQALLSMEFSRQEYWSRLPFPYSEDLPNLRIRPVVFYFSCTGRHFFFPLSHPGSPDLRDCQIPFIVEYTVWSQWTKSWYDWCIRF